MTEENTETPQTEKDKREEAKRADLNGTAPHAVEGVDLPGGAQIIDQAAGNAHVTAEVGHELLNKVATRLTLAAEKTVVETGLVAGAGALEGDIEAHMNAPTAATTEAPVVSEALSGTKAASKFSQYALPGIKVIAEATPYITAAVGLDETLNAAILEKDGHKTVEESTKATVNTGIAVKAKQKIESIEEAHHAHTHAHNDAHPSESHAPAEPEPPAESATAQPSSAQSAPEPANGPSAPSDASPQPAAQPNATSPSGAEHVAEEAAEEGAEFIADEEIGAEVGSVVGPEGTLAVMAVVAVAFAAEHFVAPAIANAAEYVAGDAVDRVLKNDDVHQAIHGVLGDTGEEAIKKGLEDIKTVTEKVGKVVDKAEHAVVDAVHYMTESKPVKYVEEKASVAAHAVTNAASEVKHSVVNGVDEAIHSEAAKEAVQMAKLGVEMADHTMLGHAAIATTAAAAHVANKAVHSEKVHKVEHAIGIAATTTEHAVSNAANVVSHDTKAAVKATGDFLKKGVEAGADLAIGTAKKVVTVENFFKHAFGGTEEPVHSEASNPSENHPAPAQAPEPQHAQAAAPVKHATASHPSASTHYPAHAVHPNHAKFDAMLDAHGMKKSDITLKVTSHDSQHLVPAPQGGKAPSQEASATIH